MSKKEENVKLDYITIAKSIGIIMVVCGHIGGIYKVIGIPIFKSKPNEIFPIYSYHMPLFIFISGYFYKSEYIYNIKELIKKRLSTLVIPYYKWNLFYGILVTTLINLGLFKNGNKISLYNYFLEPIFKGYQYNLNGPSWFLISLFFIQIAYTLIRKLFSRNNNLDINLSLLLFFSTIFINILSNNLLEKNSINLFFTRTLFGIFFFHSGYIYKNYLEHIIRFYLPILFFVIVLKYALTLIIGKNYTFSMRTMLLRDMSIIPIFWAILGIIYILCISKILENIFLNNFLKYLKNIFNFISKNTFAIMMHHMTINMFLQLIFTNINKNNIFYKVFNYSEDVIKPIICIFLSILFNKYIGKFLNNLYLKVILFLNNLKNTINCT